MVKQWRWNNRAMVCAMVACAGGAAFGQNYNDGNGREWRQLTATTGLTWNQIATVCPTAAQGGGVCSGVVGGRDFTGWHWATQDDVRALLGTFAPEVVTSGCVGGPQYAGAGIYMLGGGVINATWSAYTTFGGSLYLNGWTSTLNPQGQAHMGSASGNYPVFDGSFCVLGTSPVGSFVNYTGVWLWREVACPTPVVSTQPANVSTCAGEGAGAIFAAGASNAPTASYRWRKNGELINVQTNPTAGTSSLRIAPVGPSDAGFYDCVIAIACGSATTNAAVLTVGGGSCPVVCNDIDVNNDGAYFDPDDIDAFLSVFSEGACVPEEATCDSIDFNNDGSLFDPCDIDSFLLAFSEGPCTACGS